MTQLRPQSRIERERIYQAIIQRATHDGEEAKRQAMRKLALGDLYFLLTRILGRQDARRDWLFDRCMEVQRNPNGYLDLWSREFYKSTILTYALSIQDILNNPDITIGIFSHTRPIAKGFLYQIKYEFESNQTLKELFPDVLWENPKAESSRWSLDSGIVVRRNNNSKEATVEAHGLVDGQPTSRHFQVLVYDDVVTVESVSTPEMINKVTAAWELSLNLGARGGVQRYIGTRYHFGDTYKTIMDRGTATPRIYPATHNGKEDGEPVFLDRETLRKKRRDMGPYTFSAQMLQNPVADVSQGFKVEWLQYWKAQHYANMNLYLLCDPASEKKKTSDYTAMVVLGLGPDKNIYVITMVRDRLNLTERARMIMHLHREYEPIAVGYEKYAQQADIEHLQYLMQQENYRFPIIPLGGQVKKEDRIKRLIPDAEQGRLFLPSQCIRVNYEGRQEDLTKILVHDEIAAFPVGVHDDLLDALSRIKDEDLGAAYPKLKKKQTKLRRRDARVI